MAEQSTSTQEAKDPDMTDDQAIMWSLGIAQGDRSCLGALFDSRFDWMLTQCRMMTGRDEHFALDVVQDAMLRLARGMMPLTTAREVDRYLRAVLRTCAIDRLRSEMRRARRDSAAHTHRTPANEEPNLSAYELDELERIINTLSLHERDTLMNRIARGMGFATLASIHRTSTTIMQGRVRRLLEHLRHEAKP